MSLSTRSSRWETSKTGVWLCSAFGHRCQTHSWNWSVFPFAKVDPSGFSASKDVSNPHVWTCQHPSTEKRVCQNLGRWWHRSKFRLWWWIPRAFQHTRLRQHRKMQNIRVYMTTKQFIFVCCPMMSPFVHGAKLFEQKLPSHCRWMPQSF